MTHQMPKLLFVGAGNIAQSIMKGILRVEPKAASNILATAPTFRNLDSVQSNLGCKTTLLQNARAQVDDFKPDFVFLCVKPQVLMASINNGDKDMLAKLLCHVSQHSSTVLSLLAGIKCATFTRAFNISQSSIVRVVVNTAAEVGCTSVIYHTPLETDMERIEDTEKLLKLISGAAIRLNDENLVDVATGICGSGIAFFYEMIQSFSDIGVKNGLGRSDATHIAAQLSKAAGEMVSSKGKHPYALRDEVTSPAGTTIYGLSCWHEQSTGSKISNSVQASINRARELSKISQSQLEQ